MLRETALFSILAQWFFYVFICTDCIKFNFDYKSSLTTPRWKPIRAWLYITYNAIVHVAEHILGYVPGIR